jgi:tetratricopeptide (TPR) repeat protein
MKIKSLAAALLLLCTAALAQNATVKGKVTDVNGQPITEAQVVFRNLDIGRVITLKTDKQGNYFTIAMPSGKYRVTLSKDGKELFTLNDVPITLAVAENVINIDLKKEQGAAAPSGQPLSPEQLTEEQRKRLTEEQRKQLAEIEKENLNIKQLNELLAQAKTAREAGDFATAEGLLKKAVALDPNRELLWFNLAETQAGAAKQATDRAARKEKYAEASTSYKKSIDLLAASTDVRLKPMTGDFYNNYAKALEGAGNVEQSVAAYESAAQATPAKSAVYQFNAGAVLTNSGRVDDAVKHFDKAIAADPAYARAYFEKGNALIAKATTQGNKVVVPEGTQEAYEKYLELEPDGPFAEAAKGSLQFMGAEVKSSYRPRSAKKSDKKN